MFLVHTLIINYLYFYYFDSANVLGTFPLIRRVFLVIIDSSENNAPSRLHMGTITKNIRRIIPLP